MKKSMASVAVKIMVQTNDCLIFYTSFAVLKVQHNNKKESVLYLIMNKDICNFPVRADPLIHLPSGKRKSGGTVV